MANDLHAREIREKRNILRQEYGGMMSPTDLMRELGYRSPQSMKRWTREVGLLGTKIGARVKYDTDSVARILVNMKGMY